MRIKTSELTGAALDWMVWVLAGGPEAYPKMVGAAFLRAWKGNSAKYLHPSTDWAQGGPIIERERISILDNGGSWSAFYSRGPKVAQRWDGPTALIAAMRCFIASRLGDEVEIPKELT